MIDLPDCDQLLVAVDTETSGKHPDDGARVSIVSLAWDDQTRVFSFDQGPYTWLGPKQGAPKKYKGESLFDSQYTNLELDAWWELMDWLQNQMLIYHNSKFDQLIVNAGLRGMPDTGVDLGHAYHWDTMVVAPLLWPNERVGLDRIAALVWGQGKGDAQQRLKLWKNKYLGGKSGRYDLIPPDLVIPYAAGDAQLTLKLYHLQQELIEQGEVAAEAVDREIDLALVLYYMERAGIGFDRRAAAQADSQLAYRAEQLATKLEKMIDERPVTEHTMRRYWFDRLGIKPLSTTAGGQPQVTLDVVRELVKQAVPAAAEWQELNKVNTARSMWYTPWRIATGDDGRLRCSYRQTKSESDMRQSEGHLRGTISGRLAVERIQLQAIPHDYQLPAGVTPVRELFVPGPGRVLWEVDVSQAEMRGVAGLSGCQGLLDQFAAGVDAHTATTRLVFKVDKGEERFEFYRQIAKRLNFAIVYGAGIDTLIHQIKVFTGVDVTHQEAEGWWSAAKRAMPEVFQMSRGLQRRAERTRQIELVGGRVRHFAPMEFTHKAMNALVQGSVAVAMADAMIEVHLQYGPGLILLQIHDSIVIEPPALAADAIVPHVRQIIANTFEGHFHAPFTCDAKLWR